MEQKELQRKIFATIFATVTLCILLIASVWLLITTEVFTLEIKILMLACCLVLAIAIGGFLWSKIIEIRTLRLDISNHNSTSTIYNEVDSANKEVLVEEHAQNENTHDIDTQAQETDIEKLEALNTHDENAPTDSYASLNPQDSNAYDTTNSIVNNENSQAPLIETQATQVQQINTNLTRLDENNLTFDDNASKNVLDFASQQSSNISQDNFDNNSSLHLQNAQTPPQVNIAPQNTLPQHNNTNKSAMPLNAQANNSQNHQIQNTQAGNKQIEHTQPNTAQNTYTQNSGPQGIAVQPQSTQQEQTSDWKRTTYNPNTQSKQSDVSKAQSAANAPHTTQQPPAKKPSYFEMFKTQNEKIAKAQAERRAANLAYAKNKTEQLKTAQTSQNQISPPVQNIVPPVQQNVPVVTPTNKSSDTISPYSKARKLYSENLEESKTQKEYNEKVKKHNEMVKQSKESATAAVSAANDAAEREREAAARAEARLLALAGLADDDSTAPKNS